MSEYFDALGAIFSVWDEILLLVLLLVAFACTFGFVLTFSFAAQGEESWYFVALMFLLGPFLGIFVVLPWMLLVCGGS